MRRKNNTVRRAILLLVLLAGTACDDANVIGPENQLEVTNAADDFQFQVSVLDRVSQTLTYDWENTGPQATIDISEAITSGSATLTITDAQGTVVHEGEVANGQGGSTIAGAAGTWHIRVTLDTVTGTFNFRVQKMT